MKLIVGLIFVGLFNMGMVVWNHADGSPVLASISAMCAGVMFAMALTNWILMR